MVLSRSFRVYTIEFSFETPAHILQIHPWCIHSALQASDGRRRCWTGATTKAIAALKLRTSQMLARRKISHLDERIFERWHFQQVSHAERRMRALWLPLRRWTSWMPMLRVVSSSWKSWNEEAEAGCDRMRPTSISFLLCPTGPTAQPFKLRNKGPNGPEGPEQIINGKDAVTCSQPSSWGQENTGQKCHLLSSTCTLQPAPCALQSRLTAGSSSFSPKHIQMWLRFVSAFLSCLCPTETMIPKWFPSILVFWNDQDATELVRWWAWTPRTLGAHFGSSSRLLAAPGRTQPHPSAPCSRILLNNGVLRVLNLDQIHLDLDPLEISTISWRIF